MKHLLSPALLDIILSAILVAFLSPPVKSDEGRWKPIGTSETDTRWYIDSETVSRPSENIVSVWVKSIPDTVRDGPEDIREKKDVLKLIQERYFGHYEYTEALWEIDCQGMMFRLLYFTACGKDSETLFSTLTLDAEWSYILPGSAAETVREAVCGLSR
jgi:hypothetical protein